jgi:hypothetical protein
MHARTHRDMSVSSLAVAEPALRVPSKLASSTGSSVLAVGSVCVCVCA